LSDADLQHCNLKDAYLGRKAGDRSCLDLANAVFYGAILGKAVFVGADLQGADFRMARLDGAKFTGARIGGAKFEGATSVPDELLSALGEDLVAPEGARVGARAATS
jgi:uncharacterized protein YjbI with pentapeptide repeats